MLGCRQFIDVRSIDARSSVFAAGILSSLFGSGRRCHEFIGRGRVAIHIGSARISLDQVCNLVTAAALSESATTHCTGRYIFGERLLPWCDADEWCLGSSRRGVSDYAMPGI